jgi:hypothetical protein
VRGAHQPLVGRPRGRSTDAIAVQNVSTRTWSLFLVMVAVLPAMGLTLPSGDRTKYYAAQPDEWSQQDGLDPLPGWQYSAMVYELISLVEHRGTVLDPRVRLLAWSTAEDSRPLLVDSALLWATFLTGKERRWAVSWQFRQPRHYLGWMDATPTDVDYALTEVFDHPPSNAEVYELADRKQPSFFLVLGSNFAVHDARIREKTWLEAIGDSPSRPIRTK